MKSPERHFFEYAFPVINSCMLNKTKQKPTRHEFSRLQKLLRSESSPSRKELEERFPNAIQGLINLAKSENPKEYWTPQIVEEYWLKEHVLHVPRLCRVYFGEVIEPYNSEALVELVKSIKIKCPSQTSTEKGDIVSIHNRTIIEVLTPKQIEKYAPNSQFYSDVSH
jgi:hypothetical protein